MAGLNVPGIGSGLDIAGMSSGLAQAEMSPLISAQTEKSTTLTTKLSALSQVVAGLNSFMTTLGGLKASNISDSKLSYTNEEKVVNVEATGRAQAGVYEVQVNSIASNHRLKSQVFTDTQVFTGSVSITVGTSSTNISIDEGSSIFELANKINNADSKVNAVVINNGSGNILSLTSAEKGQAGSIDISGFNATGSTGSALDKISFTSGNNQLTEVSVANDAEILLNGVSVTSSDNSFDTAVNGLSIDINQEMASQNLSEKQYFTIEKDNSDVSNRLDTFIEHYNSLITGLKDLTKYNQDTNVAAVFTGDADIRSLSSQLSAAMINPISSVSGQYNTFYSIGVRSSGDGKFALDEDALNKALDDDPDSVMSLILNGLSSDHHGVSISTEMDDTIPSFTNSITIDTLPGISSARSSFLSSSNPLTEAITIASGISLNFNGSIIASALGEGGDDLSFDNYADLITQINADLKSNNMAIIASLDVNGQSGYFYSEITFSQMDPTQGVLSIASMGSGPLSSYNIGTATPATPGLLTYNDSSHEYFNDFTMDEGVDIDIDINSVFAGEQISISADKGYAYNISNIISSFIDDDGVFDTKEDSLNSSKDRTEELKTRYQDKQQRIEDRYLKEFQALDIMLVRMRSQSDALSAQLDQIQANSINGN